MGCVRVTSVAGSVSEAFSACPPAQAARQIDVSHKKCIVFISVYLIVPIIASDNDKLTVCL